MSDDTRAPADTYPLIRIVGTVTGKGVTGAKVSAVITDALEAYGWRWAGVATPGESP